MPANFYLFTACFLLVSCPANARSSSCPAGTQCAVNPSVPKSQPVSYLGSLLSPQCLPSFNLPLSIDNELSVYGATVGADVVPLLRVETPLAMRMFAYINGVVWNALTAFYTSAAASKYAPNMGLPFTTKMTGAANTSAARSTAITYGVLRIYEAMLPDAVASVHQTMAALNLDPTYTTATNLTDPRDIGNAAAAATIAYALNDGFNDLGLTDSTKYWPQNFSDWTNFVPSNTAYQLDNITKWQPLVETNGLGYFSVQTHITPQSAAAKPFAMTPQYFASTTVPKPYPKNPTSQSFLSEYKQQVDEVLAASASLTDYQKMVAELFDVKVIAFGFAYFSNYAAPRGWNLFQILAFDHFMHGALHDGLLLAWKEKIRHNAVRPVSAIRYLYPTTPVTAWAGPYQGTQTFPGSQFNSYLRTMPHSDYPSGTACLCVVFAEFVEKFLDTPGTMNYSYTFKAGCSMREPGKTPAQDVTINLASTADFIRDCAQSRLWAGVHFQRSIDAAKELCTGLGVIGFNYLASLTDIRG